MKFATSRAPPPAAVAEEFDVAADAAEVLDVDVDVEVVAEVVVFEIQVQVVVVELVVVELEHRVVCQARAILLSAEGNCLKAVEVANALRASLGNESLVQVRELCGGLLTTLEKHPNIFLVRR